MPDLARLDDLPASTITAPDESLMKILINEPNLRSILVFTWILKEQFHAETCKTVMHLKLLSCIALVG